MNGFLVFKIVKKDKIKDRFFFIYLFIYFYLCIR